MKSRGAVIRLMLFVCLICLVCIKIAMKRSAITESNWQVPLSA